MSEPRDELQAIERAAGEIVPALAARLGEHGLGEIEVRRGSLRVRVSAAPGAASTAAASPSTASADPPRPATGPGEVREASVVEGPDGPHLQAVTAPAVGYFVYGDGLGPGLEVEQDDALGTVDVLGVRHDVRAPHAGTIRGLVAETGEAVEYGQVLIELEVTGG